MCVNRKLRLNDLYLGVSSAHELSQILCVNNNIGSISLRKNRLGDEGTRLIIEKIRKSTDVFSLDLTANEITPQGSIFIFKALLDNQTVIDLNLSSPDGLYKNKVGIDGAKFLSHLVANNKFLQFLDVSGTSLCDLGI